MDQFTLGTSVVVAMMGRPLVMKTLRVFESRVEIQEMLELSAYFTSVFGLSVGAWS